MEIQYNKVFFVSDIHLNHRNIIKYCNRPFETVEDMNVILIANWNAVVNEDDAVFLLGDIGFCGIEKLRPLFQKLKGHIHLIQGNHDNDKVVNTLLEEGLIESVNKILPIKIIGDEECPNQELTLCHFPMIDWYGKERGSWMVHGHQHQLPDTPSCSPAHWDVGVDKNNFTPISFEQLKINITCQS